ncbi:MAG: 4-hydroxy-3-methylbut-2-enyl diphosphate reductase [Marinifilaceae bacterium]|jgi:(E)-4-hydroxy-3-methyl-but-2-enyl pyrophosphate reductase|nr:4-hydroxy-3-methylbut-2-enyl diphosphate reductase [Marinifilaceae bacterium]
MEVVIDPSAGFCRGVVNSIKKAEEILDRKEELYCIGHIVHNSVEVDRLRKRGLITINHNQLEDIKSSKVLFRAHGEPPKTYNTNTKFDNEVIDATCAVVLKLQERVKKAWNQIKNNGGQIAIFGKKGHAEVNGLVGQTEDNAIVIEKIEDCKDLDYNRDIILFSQTTKPIEGFQELISEIEKKKKADFKYYDTICRQVSNRAPKMKEFAKSYQLIIFVSDTQSSNGNLLFNICKQNNANSYFISDSNDIKKNWFQNVDSVGISGATSTPTWLMEKVKDSILNMIL